ncbi:MAG: VWA domain-containing protein [Treponema sp.]|jgi:hypothetical protein|nr:VWA domain-containing protein [Treponema sp.]
MKNRILIIISLFTVCASLHAQDLSISSGDLRLELRKDGGFHLFIRKKPDISSVLLTETTRDPQMRADNYAYRAGEWNPINGDEIRLLNGVPIPKESRVYSLISSTVVNHSELGPSFHIYIPYILYYGYEGGRRGEVYLTDGTYLNIRAFALPYADYRGAFRDNPFTLEAKQEPVPEPEDKPEDVVDKILDVLGKEKGKALDIVICLDTTNSMKKYIDPVRAKLIPELREFVHSFPSFRIGMVLFKDYYETYLTRVIQFTTDFNKFQRDLNAIRVGGGGDIPEAVHEALHDGAVKFKWEAESRVIVLVTDAPAHPKPRGKITKEMMEKEISNRNIAVHSILVNNE